MKPLHLFILDMLLAGALVFLISSCQSKPVVPDSINKAHAAFVEGMLLQ